MNDHVHQHYVPICYLKHFRFSEGKGLYTYDKKLSKDFIQSYDNICQINNFYDINDEQYIDECKKIFRQVGITEDIDNKFVEKNFFAKTIESDYDRILEDLDNQVHEINDVERISNMCFDNDLKKTLAFYIVVQLQRMPEWRENSHRFLDYLLKELNTKLLRNDDEGRFVWKKPINDAILHLEMGYGFGELVDTLKDLLSQQYWTIYISQNDEFYTSDNPVIIDKNVDDVCTRGAFFPYGSELSFPINSRMLLKVWETNYFQDKKVNDTKILLADESFIQYEQLRQYVNAQRIVISRCGDFSIIKRLLQKIGRELFVNHYTN